MPVIEILDRIAIRNETAPPFALTPSDPFLLDDPCPQSRAGHYPLWVHREIVCPHCSKVLWS